MFRRYATNDIPGAYATIADRNRVMVDLTGVLCTTTPNIAGLRLCFTRQPAAYGPDSRFLTSIVSMFGGIGWFTIQGAPDARAAKIREAGHRGRGTRRYSSPNMNILFKVMGVLLACYVASALLHGTMYARSGLWGRTFRRDEHACRYWSAIVAYALLSLALIFVF